MQALIYTRRPEKTLKYFLHNLTPILIRDICLLTITFLLSIIFAAQPAEAEDVSQIAAIFNAGSAYCALDDRLHAFDREMLDMQRIANTGKNKILRIFVRCERLHALRTGQETAIDQYGILLAPLAKTGAPTAIPGYSLKRFLDQIAKALSGGVQVDPKEMERRIEDAARTVYNISDANPFQYSTEQIGTIHRDEFAVYTGILSKFHNDEIQQATAGVSALTIVAGYVMQYSLYKTYHDQSSFDDLLKDIKPVVQSFLGNNSGVAVRTPDTRGQPTHSGDEWKGIIERALIGAGIGAVAAGLAALWKLRKGSTDRSLRKEER